MATAHETLEHLQKLLEPYIFPREQAAYRRRVLAAHLASCVRDEPLTSPLALVQSSRSINIPAEARGLHREYLKALDANISARAEFDVVQAEISQGTYPGERSAGLSNDPSSATSNSLEDHILELKLQRKQERLRVVEKHIALLNQKPAASATFLDPEEILRDTRTLPDVPGELLESLALGDNAGKTNLADLIDRLEKQVLRAKLLLKSEESVLHTVKERSTVRPENIDNHAKLYALNAARTELINWMETELSKVPADDEDNQDNENHGSTTQASTDSEQVDHQLAGIRSKYAQYLAARKSLLQLASQSPQPTLPTNPLSATEQPTSATVAPKPATYLLTPYLDRLLSLAREQKGLIAQKSHLNTTIAKRAKETVRLLDQLADESNLLPSHPVPGGSRRNLGAGTLGGSALLGAAADSSYSVSDRVRPWVYAADSAKIATLEVVAEKIEEGQVALEGTMEAIRATGRLLGRSSEVEEQGERVDVTEDDIWLADDKPSRTDAGRKHVRNGSTATNDNDLWAFLDGSLGLLTGGKE